MSCKNYIRVETLRFLASLQHAGFTNDLGLLYKRVGAVWMSVLHTKVNDSSLAQNLIEIYQQGEIQV